MPSSKTERYRNGSQGATGMTERMRRLALADRGSRYGRHLSYSQSLCFSAVVMKQKLGASLTFTKDMTMNEQNVTTKGEGRKLGGYPMVSEQIRPLTPIPAIRAKCLECSCGSRTEVRICEITKCPLWHYRMGKRPKRGLIVEDEDSQNIKYDN